LQGFAGAVEAAFDGSLRALQEAGAFGVRQVFDAGEHEDFAVTAGE
jgi:hypothetical protein